MVVLSEEVVGGLAKVLKIRSTPVRSHQKKISQKGEYFRKIAGERISYEPSKMGEQVEGDTFV